MGGWLKKGRSFEMGGGLEKGGGGGLKWEEFWRWGREEEFRSG